MDPRQVLSIATALGALGLWLMLPRGTARGRAAGAALALAGAGAWASQLPGLGPWVSNTVFGILAALTIVAAAATVTCRSPVYSAIWFGMTLAGTAGLLLLIGAEFLAVATLVVYAGAILVTFLFVLMLSQPEGRTSYDRQSWEALLSACTGAVMVGVLSMTIAGATTASGGPGLPAVAPAAQEVTQPAARLPQVAQLGAELFARNLIAVEVAGTLLLAALVGATVILARGRSEDK